ncbi:MAG: hypothetical protein GY696_22390 [Gammaproteobacteria bacterium]|nr:hypothetical protein [Gammaproteobacteria bacterium]
MRVSKEVKQSLRDCYLENLRGIARLHGIDIETARNIRKRAKNSMAAASYKERQRQEVRDLELRVERARKTGEELQREGEIAMEREHELETLLDIECWEAVTRLGGDPKTMGISFTEAGPVLQWRNGSATMPPRLIGVFSPTIMSPQPLGNILKEAMRVLENHVN